MGKSASKKRVTLKKFGTRKQPVYVFRDFYNDKGRKVKHLVESDLAAKGIRRPRPKATGRWSNGQAKAGLNMTKLIPMVCEIRDELRKHSSDPLITFNEPRGFYCKQVLVYGEQNSMSYHQDVNTRYGCLNFGFSVGLDCEFRFSFGGKDGKKEEKVLLHSGDIIIFEGQTWHTVREIKSGTSPFGKDDWLHNCRLSVPIRQNPRKHEPMLPEFLVNKRTPQKQLKEVSFFDCS